jgi:hypothetical protein
LIDERGEFLEYLWIHLKQEEYKCVKRCVKMLKQT